VLSEHNFFNYFSTMKIVVRYSSVSLSSILGKNEKVEQHIRKKTRKPNALRFWVEGGVIPLYELTRFSFLWDLPGSFPPRILPTSDIKVIGLKMFPLKKIHKPNVLRFLVEGGVILLYGLTYFLFYEIGFSQQSSST